jgi:hypothetical protein
MDNRYYTSERFIWDNIKAEAARGLKSVYESWRERRQVDPFVIAWPSETILGEDGLPVNGACVLDLPTNKTSWPETLHAFVQKTRAYALLLAEQKEREVSVVLESHHGSRGWSIPIHTSGDIRLLGEPEVTDDVHSIGILWRKRRPAQDS